MAKPKTGEVVKRELPALFCHACRTWFESQERHNSFAEVEGVKQALTVWTCPACRGKAPRETLHVARAPQTGADVAKDDRIGPVRDVVLASVVVNASGKSARATLSCGHEACISPKAKQLRCGKCRTAAKKGD